MIYLDFRLVLGRSGIELALLFFIALIGATEALANKAPSASARPPSIILILTDDQGWTSMSSAMDERLPQAKSNYHRTPYMDALIARGMRFSSGYAASCVCSPTRYSILYGKTPARLGKTLVRGPNRVDHTQTSLPQTLKRVDGRYVCAHFGKWHMNVDPSEVGYDKSDGMTTNKEGGFSNDAKVAWKGYTADDPKLTDHVTNRGIEFIQEHTRDERPFYLQLSYYAMHSDVVYQESSLAEAKTWKQGSVHKHAGYAAMLKDLDDGIGEFMKAYDELGLAENTYVFFLSDNGGMPIIPPKRSRGAPYKQGLNSPLRRGKWDLTEGGLRVPFIVLGPGIQPGAQCDAPVVTYDLLPTFADLAGSTNYLPDDLDGATFAPLLRDPSNKEMPRPLYDTLIFHLPHYNHVGLGEPHSAIRQGPYKLLKFHISRRSLLFDLETDPGETSDLSSQMPQRVKKMEQTLTDYLASVEAEEPEQSATWKVGREGKAKTKFLEEFP